MFQDGEAIEFFSRFIEFIPCTPDIVELPTQRTLQPSRRTVMAGWREENDCHICLEVMLEDIGRLHGCRIHFIDDVYADRPNYPMCSEPLRLSNNSSSSNINVESTE